MSYNTNMNNGTSAEDLERVGKLEGTKFLKNLQKKNSRISKFM